MSDNRTSLRNVQNINASIVQKGKLDAILGRERVPIGPGDTVLAPAGSAHGFLNRYEEPARLLFVFPTHQIEQVEVSIPGATLGSRRKRGCPGISHPRTGPWERDAEAHSYGILVEQEPRRRARARKVPMLREGLATTAIDIEADTDAEFLVFDLG